MIYDLHVHTKYSSDSDIEPELAVKFAKKQGFKGLAFTDHGNGNSWKEIPALKKKYKIDILKAEELTVTSGGFSGDILAYNLHTPINKHMHDADEIIDELKSQDAIVALAHPFRIGMTFGGRQEKYAKKVNAIETINGATPFFFDMNKSAKAFAKKMNMAEIGGSDAHKLFEICVAGTQFEGDFDEAISKKKTKAVLARKLPASAKAILLLQRSLVKLQKEYLRL